LAYTQIERIITVRNAVKYQTTSKEEILKYFCCWCCIVQKSRDLL